MNKIILFDERELEILDSEMELSAILGGKGDLGGPTVDPVINKSNCTVYLNSNCTIKP